MSNIVKETGTGTIVAPTNISTLFIKKPSIAPSTKQSTLTDIRSNPTRAIGPTGIKFPFRFSSTGRVAISTTSPTDPSHIQESIEQILFTRKRERFFNPLFGTALKDALFEPLEHITRILQSQLIDDLTAFEKRISIENLIVIPYASQLAVSVNLTYTINTTQPATRVNQEVFLGA